MDDTCAVRLGCICKSLSRTDIYAEPDTIHSFNPTLNERTPRLDLGTIRKIMGSLLSGIDRPPWAPPSPKDEPQKPPCSSANPPHIQCRAHWIPPPHPTATNTLSREQTSNAGAPFYRCCVSILCPSNPGRPCLVYSLLPPYQTVTKVDLFVRVYLMMVLIYI